MTKHTVQHRPGLKPVKICKIGIEQVNRLVFALTLHAGWRPRPYGIQFSIVRQLPPGYNRQLHQHASPKAQKPRQYQDGIDQLEQQLIDDSSYQG